MADNLSGQSGYLYADWEVILIEPGDGGEYRGAGINNWVGGTPYVFNFRMREPSIEKPPAKTTDGAYGTAVGVPQQIKFSGEGYYKGVRYVGQNLNAFVRPPIGLARYEYARLRGGAGFFWDFVLAIGKFSFSADAEASVQWKLEGVSDGYFPTQYEIRGRV
jgi:hypothetical protein